MKKIICLLVMIITTFLPTTVLALDLGTGGGTNTNYLESARNTSGYSKNTTETSFASTLGLVVNVLLSFAGVIFMMLMVYAGYLWMTARGEEAKIDKAQNIIKSAVIGLIIAVGAYSITNLIVPTILGRVAGG